MKRDKITTITKVTEVGVADYERELYGNLSPVASLVKRGFDVVASLLGLILSSPFSCLSPSSSSVRTATHPSIGRNG